MASRCSTSSTQRPPPQQHTAVLCRASRKFHSHGAREQLRLPHRRQQRHCRPPLLLLLLLLLNHHHCSYSSWRHRWHQQPPPWSLRSSRGHRPCSTRLCQRPHCGFLAPLVLYLHPPIAGGMQIRATPECPAASKRSGERGKDTRARKNSGSAPTASGIVAWTMRLARAELRMCHARISQRQRPVLHASSTDRKASPSAAGALKRSGKRWRTLLRPACNRNDHNRYCASTGGICG